MKDQTRRRFLRTGSVVGIAGLTGCSQITGGDDIKDTDGDGVIDSEDYAPRDASVQDAEDVEETESAEEPEESGSNEEEESAEQNDGQGGNTFSIEMGVGDRTRFSETVTVENVSTSQPDIVIGTRYRGEGGCNESSYEANVSNMTMAYDSETNNITNNVSLQDFSRDDRRKEVYSNPADGSDSWTLSFNIEPLGTDIPHPNHWKCYATAHIRLTEGTQWFDNPDETPPNNTIDYMIARQQPGSSDESGSLQHGVVVTGSTDRNVGRLRGNVDDASNAGRYDWYEEDVEWDITITRR